MDFFLTFCVTQFGSFNFFRVIFLIASRERFCWKLQLHRVLSLLYLPSILCFFKLSDLSLVCLKLRAWRCCSIYISSALLCRCKNSPNPPDCEERGERELWRSGWSIDEAPDLTQVPVPSLNLDRYPIPADIYRIGLWKQITNDFQILEECFQSSSSSRSNAWTWIWAYSPFYSFFFSPSRSFLCVVLPSFSLRDSHLPLPGCRLNSQLSVFLTETRQPARFIQKLDTQPADVLDKVSPRLKTNSSSKMKSIS